MPQDSYQLFVENYVKTLTPSQSSIVNNRTSLLDSTVFAAPQSNDHWVPMHDKVMIRYSFRPAPGAERRRQEEQGKRKSKHSNNPLLSAWQGNKDAIAGHAK